ncbi:hypothetical protein [Pseudaestuariivita sp.]|uniref:hypothetical protein n=1 Tax=Pseudaestuariivita sp. TaxID=2211669 RepID=UPI00405954DC
MEPYNARGEVDRPTFPCTLSIRKIGSLYAVYDQTGSRLSQVKRRLSDAKKDLALLESMVTAMRRAASQKAA